MILTTTTKIASLPMQKVLLILLLKIFFSQSIQAQIHEPDGVRLPGDWNSWTNFKGMGGAFDLTKETTGTVRWHSKFEYTGTSGAQAFKFASGEVNPWANQWTNNANVSLNSFESFEWTNGGNNSILVNNGHWYTVNYRDNGYSNSDAMFMETSSKPVTLDNLSNSKSSNILPWDKITISITASSSPCSEENVFLRYSIDNFTTSTLVQFNFDGPTGVATIPAFTDGTTVVFYAYSSTLNKDDIGLNHDMATINFLNNGGSNYSYTVETPETVTSIKAGNFSDGEIWTSGTKPTTGQTVLIDHDVIFDEDYEAADLTINNGCELSFQGTEKLTIKGNGNWENNGSFIAGNSTIEFEDDINIHGTSITTFNHVIVAGKNTNFDNAFTKISGTIRITTGSIQNMPELLEGSTLQYEQGSSITRGIEWNNPWHVVITNNTILDLNINDWGSDIEIPGNLNINTGSGINLGEIPNEDDLIVNGNLTVAGTLTLSSTYGADLYIKGDFLNTGSLITNSRTITFNGNTDQEIFGETTFDYLDINKASGKVMLNNNIEVSNILWLNQGLIIGNNNTITINNNATSAIANASSTSYIVGTIKRAIPDQSKGTKASTYVFPIGTAISYNPATINFTTLPTTAGTIEATFNSNTPSNYSSGLPITDGSLTIDHLAKGGYWELTPTNIANYTYDLSIQGSDFTDDPAYEINDADRLRLVMREDFSSPWQFNGTHGTGTAAPPTVSRTNISNTMGVVAMGAEYAINPLPVELSYFNCSSSPNGVLLSWQTLSEINNNTFEIYRSTNATDYSKITEVKGAGNSATVLNYSFTDNNASLGLNYYYLKQIDFDGKSTNSKVVSVNLLNTCGFSIKNINNQLHINANSADYQTFYYRLFNISGKLIQKGKVLSSDKNATIELPSNNNEHLIIQIQSNNKVFYSKVIPACF